jgi:REP element-mobilizing transposase RayT
MKQLKLFHEKPNNEFGGALLKGKRKSRRLLSTKKSIHLVLKSSNPQILLRSQSQVQSIIERFAQKFSIKIYSFAVHADHIHLNVGAAHRDLYKKWIRAVTKRF